MSAEDIPMEILVMIFENVEARDVIACRGVCRRWRDVVDSLSDELWERYCSRDYWNPETTNKDSNLSFRELYKSLTLWSKVEKAEVICRQLPDTIVSYFKILNNNTIAVIMKNIFSTLVSKMYDNQVEYYDMENMKLISRERYRFPFTKYDENDKLITLVDTEGVLRVITKSNKKFFFVGNVAHNYTLFDAEVYFVNTKKILCLARLKVVDGQETIETEELEEVGVHLWCQYIVAFSRGKENSVKRLKVVDGQETIETEELEEVGVHLWCECIVAFSRGKENSVKMLTDRGVIYSYHHHDKVFKMCSRIDTRTPDIDQLKEFGSHWSGPKIYRFLRRLVKGPTELHISSLYLHNHVVLIGTRVTMIMNPMVHIFQRPYKKNGELKLNEAKLNRSIDMEVYSGGVNKYTVVERYMNNYNIKQLGISEIMDGHRIVVLTDNKLFFVDLVHKAN